MQASPRLAEHREHLESFTERLLRPYVDYVKTQIKRGGLGIAKRPKEINDPIWETIVLYPLEVVLLDSPLLQRLRRIRQLGVAHWVYPGGSHTRLEHSLGTVHQVSRLIGAINGRAGEIFIDESQARSLRVMALCHDVGHGVMSHVSENALKSFRSHKQLELDFVDHVEIERTKPSEIAAYYMLGSPAFSELLETAQQAVDGHLLPTGLPAKMQKAIIGATISDDIPLLHELISGPFDADKLDYMPRDAFMTGVPVVTDISRLVQKVRAVKVSQADLPPEVARFVRADIPAYTMTGIALSGARAVDELMLGRTLLFDKIYRHQKVRAAEAMVASIMVQIADLVSETPSLAPYEFVDDELLNITPERVRAAMDRRLTRNEKKRVQVAVDLSRRLRDRRLFVRSFAFAQNMPEDPYAFDVEQWTGLEELQRAAADQTQRDQLIAQIGSELRSILEALDATAVTDSFPDDDLHPYLWLDPPEPPTQGSEIARAFLIPDNPPIMRFRDDSAETRAWADAYLLARNTGYIFAPAEISPYVFLAAEKVVRAEFGVRIPSSMLAYAKQSQNQLEEMRRQLVSSGYYASVPHDLRPLPERLSRADVSSRVESIVRNLSGYHGLLENEDDRGKINLDSDRVLDWLRQFEDDNLIEAALTILEHVRLFGRADTNDALRTYMKRHPEFTGGFLCPLGGPKDSSSVCSYYAGDVAREYELDLNNVVEQALAYEKPIVFVDDFIGSGSQAMTILERWLGEPQSEDLGEDRGQPLSPELRGALRKRKLALVFAAGWEEGVSRLKNRIQELKLDGDVYLHIPDADLPHAFGGNHFRNEKQESDFLAKCKEIGRALLSDRGLDHDNDWVEERVLGYGNRGMLVVFPYNTPAQTLTCLWERGEINSIQWRPLLPRRRKV